MHTVAAKQTSRRTATPCKLTMPFTGSRGFTLFSVCAALFLGSVVAVFAVPVIQDYRRDSRARATVAELKRMEDAFLAYAQDHGNWPEGTAEPGEYPPGMENALASTRWSNPSPIGGRYVWLTETMQRGARIHAMIAITSFNDDRVSQDRRQLEALSRLAKAGGLTPANLRLGYRNEPIYVLEY